MHDRMISVVELDNLKRSAQPAHTWTPCPDWDVAEEPLSPELVCLLDAILGTGEVQ
jgi:hypothetical protein